ncbi:MAG: protein kinase [Planctomycetales bacterium]|nr:protein kinase [Planctomycetales bacterium]
MKTKHTDAIARDVESPAEDEARLTRAMEEYLAKLEAGEDFDRATFLEKHADLEPMLSEAIESIDFLNVYSHRPSQFPKPTHDSSDSVHSESEELGDFRLVREIGRGGMGVVYEAEQRSLQRTVAIKVLPFAALLDRGRLARFQNEARAAAMLRHPHIVGVFSVGCERGIHYYTMELIDGQSLAEVIDRLRSARGADNGSQANSSAASETVPIARLSTDYASNRKSFFRGVARLGIEACDALQYAHQRGVVHRDIKPSNLLLDNETQVHVADFGLARIEAGNELTMTGDVVGTLRYMSPEQLDGRVVDERTDVYSLGVTLYELVTGKLAFDAEHRQELTKQIFEANPTRPSKIEPTLPHDLETIVIKAISKDPNDRYRSAEEFGNDLRRFLDGKPVTARSPSRVELTRRWIGRNRFVSSLMAIVVVLLLALSAGSTLTAIRLASDAEDKQDRAYSQDLHMAHEAARKGDFVTAEETLLNWMPESGDEDRRNFEWYYAWKLAHNPAIERTFQNRLTVYDVEFLPGDKLAIARWSEVQPIWDLNRDAKAPPAIQLETEGKSLLAIPEENLLIVGTHDGEIEERDARTGELLYPRVPLEIANSERDFSALAISHDRRFIAVGSGVFGFGHTGHVAVFDRNERQWTFETIPFENPPRVAFGADGLLYVAERNTSKLSAIDIQEGRTVEDFELPFDKISDFRITNDGQRVVAIANPQHGKSVVAHVVLWDIARRKVIASSPIGTIPLRSVAVSGDASLIAVGENEGVVRVLDGNALNVLATVQAHSGVVNDLAFSNDSLHLATASSDGFARTWSVEKLTQSATEQVALKEPTRYMFGADFLTDTEVVSADNDGRLIFWDAETGESETILQLDYRDTNLHQLAVSPDRGLVAVTSGLYPPKKTPSLVHLVDANSKEVIWENSIETGIMYSISSFSPDGRFLAVSAKWRVLIYDVASGQVAHTVIRDGAWFKPAVFSPDGSYLACGTIRGQIHLLRCSDFATERVIDVREIIDDAQFSLDSQTLIATGIPFSTEQASLAQSNRLENGNRLSPV